MGALNLLAWPAQLNLHGMDLGVRVGHTGREVHCGMGSRFWSKLDFPGQVVPKSGSLPVAVGPVGEEDSVSHWLCPCATKLVEHKGGKSDK